MAFTMVRGHSIEDSITLSFSNFIGLFKSTHSVRFAKLRLAPYFSAVSPLHLQPPPCQWEWQGHSRLCGYSLPFLTPSRISLVGPLPVAVERPNANGFLWKLSFGPWWLFNFWSSNRGGTGKGNQRVDENYHDEPPTGSSMKFAVFHRLRPGVSGVLFNGEAGKGRRKKAASRWRMQVGR